MTVINYEFDIEEIVSSELSKKFNIEDTNLLFLYLKIRTACIDEKYRWKDKDSLIKTIYSELFINDNKYKGQQIFSHYARYNSFSNIIDNFEFQLDISNLNIINGKPLSPEEIFEKFRAEIYEYSIQKSKKYKRSNSYSKYVLYYRLLKLNELFNINEINEVNSIPGFNQDESRINLELALKREIEADNIQTKNLAYISEEELENYIYKNIDIIDPNLVVIGHQVEIDEGRIDILAMDKNDTYVIIELKIDVDKRLIWQCMYYPEAFKDIYKVNKVRMITITPDYPEYIKKPLSKIKNIEAYSYNATISNHKIEGLSLRRVM